MHEVTRFNVDVHKPFEGTTAPIPLFAVKRGDVFQILTPDVSGFVTTAMSRVTGTCHFGWWFFGTTTGPDGADIVPPDDPHFWMPGAPRYALIARFKGAEIGAEGPWFVVGHAVSRIADFPADAAHPDDGFLEFAINDDNPSGPGDGAYHIQDGLILSPDAPPDCSQATAPVQSVDCATAAATASRLRGQIGVACQVLTSANSNAAAWATAAVGAWLIFFAFLGGLIAAAVGYGMSAAAVAQAQAAMASAVAGNPVIAAARGALAIATAAAGVQNIFVWILAAAALVALIAAIAISIASANAANAAAAARGAFAEAISRFNDQLDVVRRYCCIIPASVDTSDIPSCN
jgi:hypothetical protein